eukprot:741470_1
MDWIVGGARRKTGIRRKAAPIRGRAAKSKHAHLTTPLSQSSKRSGRDRSPSVVGEVTSCSSLEAKLNLWVHDERFSEEQVIINPEVFPRLKVGNILEISHPEKESGRLLLRVAKLENVKGKLQVSILKSLADLFELQAREDVFVRVVSTDKIHVDFIALSFCDQYISRGDMWRFKRQIQEQCVHVTKTIGTCGLKAQIDDMWVNGQTVACGLVTSHTKFLFRSRSAKIFWLVQLGSEMWDLCDSDSELYFEKVVDGFLNALCVRWRDLKVSHSVTIVFFARTFYKTSGDQIDPVKSSIPTGISSDSKGRLFRDTYKVVLDTTSLPPWDELLKLLKTEFYAFPKSMKWYETDPVTKLSSYPSTSAEGNVLETINLTIDKFDRHYVDRDLERTGQAMEIIIAGPGVFFVDNRLAELTEQRIVDSGIGCDLISVAAPPIHTVPLFVYRDVGGLRSSEKAEKSKYSIPSFWLQMRFFNLENCLSYSDLTDIPRISYDSGPEHFIPLPSGRILNNLVDGVGLAEAKDSDEPSARKPVPPPPLDILHSGSRPSLAEMAAYDKMSLCVPEDGEDHIRHSISSPNLKFQKEVRFLEHSPISEGWDISSSRLTPPSRSTVQDMSRVLARISRSFEDSSVLRTVHTNIPSPVLSAKKHNRQPYDEKRSASPTVIPHLVPGVSSLRESSLRDVRISMSPSSKMDNYLKPRSLDSPSHTEAARESSDVEIICGSHEDEYRGMSGSMNPFRHHTHQEKPKEGRWNHLFPTGQEYSSITGRTMLDIRDCHEPEYWTTMIEPAVLPLSTDYAPAKSQMQRHIYQISLDPMRQDFEDSSGLFVEMMTQRLCHGFQLVLSDSKGFLANRQPSPLSVAPLSPGQSYELYLNKQLHNLQLFENGNIEVSRSFAPYDANPLRLP